MKLSLPPTKMKLSLLLPPRFLTLQLVLLLSVPVLSSPCHFPAVINLGDSNSDTGGLSAAFGPVRTPYGETFFRMPAGRYSDGRLMIDFIAESFGLPYLSAYLDSLGANFRHGANFALAGATIVPQNIQGGYNPISLYVQLDEFLQFKSRSQIIYERGGFYSKLMPRKEYFSQALYTFDIGQNDITAFAFANISANDYVPNTLNEFSSVIKRIYEEGGRSFWIHNTGPLGCLTYTLLRTPLTEQKLDSAGCSIHYNELAQQFNRMLNETAIQLRKDLPLAAITLVDIYSAKYKLISEGTKYGFEHPLRVCCGYGGGEYNYDFFVGCSNTGEVNGTTVLLGKSCKDPSKSIIWDGVHYTEAANRWVFDQIKGGAFSDPPVSLSMACHKEKP